MAASADNIPLRQNLTQSLVNNIVNAPSEEERGRNDGQYLPLHRQRSTQLNRDRFEENQRVIAAQILSVALVSSVCAMCIIVVLLLALILTSLVVYIQGWVTWSSSRKDPCDQPLEWWLLVKLVTFLVNLVNMMMYRWSRDSQNEKCFERFQVAFRVAAGVVTLVIGWWLLFSCKTCPQTNPELYGFVKFYLIYNTAAWVVARLLQYGLTSIIFWLARSGLLQSGPGPAMAATPGLINNIQTVPYSPDLFSDREEEYRQPPECCICQDRFATDAPIKQTPCGHYFHEECLGTWLGRFAKSCPLCRTNLEVAVDQAAQLAASAGTGPGSC